MVILQQMQHGLRLSANNLPRICLISTFSAPPAPHDAATTPANQQDLREQGSVFMPRFDSHGLVTAVAVDRTSGRLLMLAHMNAEAIERTRETGHAHFWSRSRGRLWMKGESSGHVLRVVEIRVDCDQDALELIVDAAGPACHTMAQSCFYRRIAADGSLERVAGD